MRRHHLWTRSLVGLAVAVTALACTRSQKAKDASEAELSPEQRKAMEEYREEVEVGRNMAGRLLAYYGIVDDQKLIGYLNQVGDYVASYSDFPERRYMFAILKHESVNAFACPGGYILVTLGALRNARNEAELAMVLGHEVAHVGRKHMFDALRKMKEKELEATAKSRETGGAMQEALRVRERPKAEENGFGTQLAKYISGSGAAGAGLNVLAAAAAGMTLITEKGLGSEVEFEADSEGVKYAIRAGYAPKAMLAYLGRLEDKTKTIKNLEKTHPPIADRRKAIARLLRTLKADEIIGATGEDRFSKAKDALPKAEN